VPRTEPSSRHRLGAATSAVAALLLVFPLAAQDTHEPACELKAGPRHAVVRIIDAETVLLDDDREVRLIGALAPRSPDLRPEAQAWQPEQDAIAALRDLVLGRTVELAYSGRRRDRYGRLLAHLFVQTGGERVWVQGRMLSEGHARAYGLPGNFACMRELLAHEQVARSADLGLWSNATYAAQSAFKTRAILRNRNTYQIVTGKVAEVATTKARTYLNFGRDWRRDFTAGIDANVLAKNPKWANALSDLAGRRIEVRGWIEYRNGPYIAVEDPHQIAAVDDAEPPRPAGPGGPTMSSGQKGDTPLAPRRKRKHPAPDGPGAFDL
jgi:endonuclease YncB( thermonuclease family)